MLCEDFRFRYSWAQKFAHLDKDIGITARRYLPGGFEDVPSSSEVKKKQLSMYI